MTAVDDLFAAILDVSPVGIAIADENGCYIDVNPAYCEMFGYRREDLLGQTFGLILLPEQKMLEADILLMALNNDRSAPNEWQVMARSGNRLTVRSNFRTLTLPDGRRRIITVLHDITALHNTISQLQDSESRLQQSNEGLESMVAARTASLGAANQELLEAIGQLEDTRRALEENERSHRLLIETAHDAVVTIDSSGAIISWNQAAEQMFGWSLEEAIGGNLGEMIIPDGYRERHAQGLQHFQSGKPSQVLNRTVEVFALRRHRGGFPVELSIWNHQRDGRTVFSAFIRDITARKQAEQEVLEALERAQELAMLKSRFVSMTSHEFRTPLTIIKSSVDLLRDYRDHLDPAEYRRILDDINTGIQRMTNMLDQALTLGRTDENPGGINPAALNIEKWARSLVEELTLGNLGGERITIDIQGTQPWRMVDERLLRQATVNLLTNALKYSPENRRIEFSIEMKADALLVDIEDHGIGIPEKEQEKLFESFFRASNVGQIAGTGLGLAIVQKSIELHGGRLDFRSVAGQGSRFWFTVPALSTPPASA